MTKAPETQQMTIQSFKRDAESVLRAFQDVFCEVLDILPGPNSKPPQIAKELNIDKKLAWHVLKIAQSTDPYAIAQYIPGNIAYGTLATSMAKIPELKPLATDVKGAYKNFEELIRVHAGDRASLEMMLTACSTEDNATADLSHKRMAFRGNSYIWGIQAKTSLSAVFIQPSDDPSCIDVALLSGIFRLRRLRGNAPLTIAQVRHSDSDGVVRRQISFSPIEPTSSPNEGIPVLKDFCSHPMPQTRSVKKEDGVTNYELVGNDIGDTAAITCVEASVAYRAASRYRDQENPYIDSRAAATIPCEVLILDLIVREGTYGPISPRALVCGDLLLGVSDIKLASNTLVSNDKVNYLGKGPAALRSQDVPQYPKMGSHIFDKLGWDGQRFDVYRLRIEYPVVPSAAIIRFDLPDPPA